MRTKSIVAIAIVFVLLIGGTLLLWHRWLSVNVPIHFYGRGVGPDGNPIVGAKIVAQVSARDVLQIPVLWSGADKHQVGLVDATSNESGEFELNGVRGSWLRITGIIAPSLEPGPGQYNFDFLGGLPNIPRYIPDRTDPAEFKLRAKSRIP